MNSQIDKIMKIKIQFGKENPITFDQKIRPQVPQIQDYKEEFCDEDDKIIYKKLWDEQKLDSIPIPEDDDVTNLDVCGLMYDHLQKPQKQQEFSKHKNPIQNNSIVQINKHIENILFMKFLINFHSPIIDNNSQTQPQQTQKENQNIGMSQKKVVTDILDENQCIITDND